MGNSPWRSHESCSSSPFLLAVGLALLCGYTFLGKRYWFKIPFRGILIALALYVGALIAAAA